MTVEPADITAWQRAVDLGALGRAAAARVRLQAIIADRDAFVAAKSLAYSTHGSLTRQAGGHALARRADGAACRMLAGVADKNRDPWTAAAWADALIGVAADDLGVGDLRASDLLLDRAAAHLAACGDAGDWRTVPRVRLRLAWVRTERRLYGGDPAGAAAAFAVAAPLAAAVPSPRHRVKTDLIGAAVQAAAGDTELARRSALRVYERTGDLHLEPLRWAAASMLAGLDPGAPEYPFEISRLRRSMARSGMPFTPLQPGEHQSG
ncbi:MAG: hypothetical protein QM774_01245 [Gordonia sp. (in: high G+C Gram-positive bacteria)]|uniref:hypothetical protein n=1 Tax=Gordonia sp. (in: high G+C Gram-positive bacteria) TaxID=84139 RepID=UPI0039E3D6E3